MNVSASAYSFEDGGLLRTPTHVRFEVFQGFYTFNIIVMISTLHARVLHLGHSGRYHCYGRLVLVRILYGYTKQWCAPWPWQEFSDANMIANMMSDLAQEMRNYTWQR